MKKHSILLVMLALLVGSCSNKEVHEHEGHEAHKVQYTSYSSSFELFAEADAFIVGDTSNVLSHFTYLSNFKPLDSTSVSIHLLVNGKECKQGLSTSTRKGIYSFDIVPQTAGKGQLIYQIKTAAGIAQVIVNDVVVYANDEEAETALHEEERQPANATVFTKEQSWKIDFATAYPLVEPFGQVIKTTAEVQSAQGDEQIISAKSAGIVLLASDAVLEGDAVTAGKSLFVISSAELSENNLSVKYAEAKNNYDKTKADYERASELAEDKIVSKKDLLNAKTQFENAKAVYTSLSKNFSGKGQTITSPRAGYIKQVFVKNGAYVEAGQPLASITQNKTLVLSAEVQQKYAALLGSITSANIRTISNDKSYTLQELNGRVLSYAKSSNSDNYLLPVKLQIDNKGEFVAGSFVEVYLKTSTNKQALTVPNTALIEIQGSFYVYVQHTPELFEKREVKIGVSDGIKTEIVEGISPKERIVSLGALLIKLAQATGTLDAHSGHVH